VVTTLLALRLKAEDHVDDEKTLEVFRAVIRAPNARIHDHYPEYWSAFEDELHGALSGITRDEVAKGIRGCLKVIAEMAANFARAEATRGEYGANIMLFVWRDNSGGPLFPKSLVAALRFHSATDLGALRGMLYLPGDLTVRSLDDAHVRVIPNFALPVPDTGSSSAPPPIPGAPFAVIDGGSVHGDARTIADSEACEYFSKSVRDQIREYFSERGAGRNVGSFASYRIGTGTKPAGVLNLDTNHRHVLGPHEEFYTTFTALVVPMLEGLRFAVERYTEGLDIGALALSDAAAAAAAAAKPSSPPSPPKPPPAAEIPAPEV
jgi:hypothetical protein